jgi:hypothetical protein
MKIQDNQPTATCPVTVASIQAQVRQTVDELLDYCATSDESFFGFEKRLLVLMMTLGQLLIRVFLTARHERLELAPYLEDGRYRRGDPYAECTLKTAYGEVCYGRAHLIPRRGGAGFHPLDVVLVLTRDHLSPWVMQLVAKLATRMSFAAARLVCKAALQWAPASETIEQVVLGMGRMASPFMAQLAAPDPQGEGEVLVIEVDGKCPPTATAAELAKRRGKRPPKHERNCACGCQRHRGQAKRKNRGSKKRRKKGDKSKNGKEVVVVVMYTLKRGPDGKLHGPLNKKVWGVVRGPQGSGTVGACASDQAWLRPGNHQDGADRDRRSIRTEGQPGAVVSQGDLHVGRVSHGGEVVVVGPSLPQGVQRGAQGVGGGTQGAVVRGPSGGLGRAPAWLTAPSAVAWTGNEGPA